MKYIWKGCQNSQAHYMIPFIVTKENSESHLLCVVYIYLHDSKMKKILAA